MKLVIYGDFNCPYSYLASARVDALLAREVAEVEWRAVEHDPAIPQPSEPVAQGLAATLDREVTEVRDLLHEGESFSIRRPSFHPNTARAVAAFAAAPVGGEHDLRRRLFAALWRSGRDIGEPAVIRGIGSDPCDGEVPLVSTWRDGWRGFERPVVPILALPDGYVSRGLGALTRLAALVVDAPPPGDSSRAVI